MGDITCIPTGEGRLYPAIVKGLCTGKRVGCAFSSPIDTTLPLEELEQGSPPLHPVQGTYLSQ